MTTTDTPRVWIGCLACYNAGTLAGEWFDAIDCPTEMTGEGEESWQGRINERVVHVHPDHYRDGHEELWVMDHDGFRGALKGECSPATAQELAEALESLDDSDIPWEACVAYADNCGHQLTEVADWKDECEEAWNGEHSSREDFAYQLADDLGAIKDDDAWPYTHIDWEGAARDLFLGGDYWDADAPGGGIYVFGSN